MSQVYAQLGFAARHFVDVVETRVERQMVGIVDGEPARHRRLIVAIAVGERSVEAHHGQVVGFQLRLQLLEVLARERTIFNFFQPAGNLSAGVGNLLAVERSVQ